jgi:glycerol-3-phosphate dehydrogenase
VTRDYVLKLGREAGPQILSVYGGKLTTYRRLAEHALELLAPFLPQAGPAWTGRTPLPGGDLGSDFATFLDQARQRYPFLPADVAKRMGHAYGARMSAVLGAARQWADLGRDFGGGLTEVEAAYLVDHEWARTAEDILWRRTKIGLSCPPRTEPALTQWLATRTSPGG